MIISIRTQYVVSEHTLHITDKSQYLCNHSTKSLNTKLGFSYGP